MALSDIAAGVAVTSEQRDRGVAVVDDTDVPLAERLASLSEDLPCSADEAATLVEAYAEGKRVGGAAAVAGLAPMTGAKALHLLGETVNPLAPTARRVVRDWLDAEFTRAEALELTDASEGEFALAAYVETHEPLDGARDALAGALSPDRDDPLADARSGADEFLQP